jgi:hypothetical protein
MFVAEMNNKIKLVNKKKALALKGDRPITSILCHDAIIGMVISDVVVPPKQNLRNRS